jgi:hypothetical protein
MPTRALIADFVGVVAVPRAGWPVHRLGPLQ